MISESGGLTHASGENAGRQKDFRKIHPISTEKTTSPAAGMWARGKGMVTSMNEIQLPANPMATITQVIDQIAFQTNLFALNAAVEAAREPAPLMEATLVKSQAGAIRAIIETAAVVKARLDQVRPDGEGIEEVTKALAQITSLS
jgi:hypothetical protein